MNRPRSTMWSLGLALVAACLGFALAACGTGGGGQAQSGDQPVRISVVPGFGSLPIEIARAKGFFQSNGVNAQILPNTSTASFAPGLGKQYDFILSTPIDFLSAASKGIDITAVTGMQVNSAKSPNNVLLTKQDSIRTIADLKGKRIGVVSLAGTTYGIMVYALQQAGIAKNDVTFVSTPFATMEDQLSAGNIDAALSTAPFWSSSLPKGYRIVMDLPFETMGEGSLNAFYSSSKQYAQANPKTVSGFRAAMNQAIRYIQDNPADARTTLESWLKLPQAVVEAAPLPAFNSALDPSKIEPYIKVAQVSGQVSGSIPDPSTLIWPGSAS